ncbi:uncharacterized protein TNCV_1721311 [Trichonephila clavipes]|nr:uncharacterized protein TNCV_1721311 [Trichonephila clavipes]
MPPNTHRMHTEYVLVKSVGPKVLWAVAAEATGAGSWRIFSSPPVPCLNWGGVDMWCRNLSCRSLTCLTGFGNFQFLPFEKDTTTTIPRINDFKIKELCTSKMQVLSGKKEQNILKPSFEEEIHTLNGKDIDKVELHMDKTSSHTSKSTAAYLAKKESETGINYIPFDDIVRVKSPYASVMDFCAFSFY